ncbi:hypothetical protein MMC18_009437 [Xylographa bjoerkii]|nr:hypothetical protein [Xylographa bjoerkii]
MDDALHPSLSRTAASIDEGYCSSVPDSITDLSTRFGRHSLRPRDEPPRASLAHHHPRPAVPQRRSSPHSSQLHSVRHQRHLATRRQCSTENLARISHLVERLLHDGDAHYLSARSTARIAHQTTYHPPGALPSLSATPAPATRESASTCSSPLSPTSSAFDDSESDYGRAVRSPEQPAPAARAWSAIDGARSRRKDAVEKTIRMRKRPGGKTARCKD